MAARASVGPRRTPTDADLARLVVGSRSKLNQLGNRLANGILDPQEYIEAIFAVLEDSHADAVVLGRWLGGDLAPRELDDDLFAQLVMDGESQFLEGFLNDLQTGRYLDSDGNLKLLHVKARARMYSGKLRATANETFVLASPVGEKFAWHDLTAESCGDCPVIAAGGPYTASDFNRIGYPGQGRQACKTQCGCVLVRLSDSRFGFSRSYD